MIAPALVMPFVTCNAPSISTAAFRLMLPVVTFTALSVMTAVIRLLVLLACVMLAFGAWQQVVVGWGSTSVVMSYPSALLPLPALLCAVAIGAMAFWEVVQRTPLDLGHSADMD